MIKVDANLFRIVYAAVSTEETRYYLNGVHIEAHPEQGAILVSTDGHRMIVAHDPKGECSEGVIVALPLFARQQCKTPPMFTAKRILEIDTTLPAGSATIKEVTPGKKETDEPKVESIVTVHRVLIDGTFPEWRRVVPNQGSAPKDAKPAAFNPKYLGDWGKVGAEIGKAFGNVASLSIALSDGGSPTVVRFEGAPNIFGIQMPMRSSISGYLPPFMSQPAFKEAAE